MNFPRYTTSFHCACSAHEAIARIGEAVIWPENRLKQVKIECPHDEKIEISSHTGELLYYNSFMPIVKLGISGGGSEVDVSVEFELKKGVKRVAFITFILALFFEIVLCALWLTGQLTNGLVLCVPLGMVLFGAVISAIGLKVSSKGVLRILYDALTRTERGNLNKC